MICTFIIFFGGERDYPACTIYMHNILFSNCCLPTEVFFPVLCTWMVSGTFLFLENKSERTVESCVPEISFSLYPETLCMLEVQTCPPLSEIVKCSTF